MIEMCISHDQAGLVLVHSIRHNGLGVARTSALFYIKNVCRTIHRKKRKMVKVGRKTNPGWTYV